MRQLIKANPQTTPGDLISLLNPVIRGWANYHRHVVSKKIFTAIDDQIFQALWRWAKRRHPQHSRKWIKAKYFSSQGNRQWVFTGYLPDTQGTLRPVRLFSAARVPIIRHIKVKVNANPYDLLWEPYFERRLATKMNQTFQHKRVCLLSSLASAGRAMPCLSSVYHDNTGWEKHYHLWRVYGGDNSLDNLVLLHPNCHKQVHCLGLSVPKPRPSPGV